MAKPRKPQKHITRTLEQSRTFEPHVIATPQFSECQGHAADHRHPGTADTLCTNSHHHLA
jgi:hypothetical protein